MDKKAKQIVLKQNGVARREWRLRLSSVHSYVCNLITATEKPEKYKASTVFHPVTPAILL